MTAICHRCGSHKRGPLVPCKACTFTPTGPERPIAWLFSTQHLTEPELGFAQARIQRGDRPDPSRALQQEALLAMGARALPDDAHQPFGARILLGITAANVLLTSLVGYAVWLGLHNERPIAARQVLRITIPVTVTISILWILMVMGAHLP